MRLFTVLVASFLVGSIVESIAAQNCAVRNRYRIANSYSGATSELQVDTGWQTTAPLSTPGTNTNPGATCNSSGSCHPISDYGFLRVSGAGSATNCASSGVFLYLDTVPQAQFTDQVTITSATLPNGTPVQIRVILTMAGSVVLQDPNPSLSYQATTYAGSLTLSLTDAVGTAVGIVNSYVGSPVMLQGGLGVTLYPYGLLGLGSPPITSSYSVDLTARVGVECLTPGASLSFCSGRSYAPLAAEVHAAGGGCGAGSPSLTASTPFLGQTQAYSVASTIANEPVFLAASFGGPVSSSIGSCIALVDLPNAIVSLAGATDAQGACGFALWVPNASWLAGIEMMTQVVVLQSGGPVLGAANLSNALGMTFGL